MTTTSWLEDSLCARAGLHGHRLSGASDSAVALSFEAVQVDTVNLCPQSC